MLAENYNSTKLKQSLIVSLIFLAEEGPKLGGGVGVGEGKWELKVFHIKERKRFLFVKVSSCKQVITIN